MALPPIVQSDTRGLSRPLTKFIETIGAGIGQAYEPTHVRRMAKAQADANLIMAANRSAMTALEARAANRLMQQEARRQENIEAIAQLAAEAIDAKPESEVSEDPVNTDWVHEFFEQCKDVGTRA